MSWLTDMMAAANRLLTYYNGDEKTALNPGGMTGPDGMAQNWDPCIRDIGTGFKGVGEALTSIATSESNTAGSAAAAAGSATAANASKLAAATSEGNAAGSATAAANNATAAADSATAANASKLAAATSEGNAAASATLAINKATLATTKAGEAAASATTATDKATLATAKAGEAAASATTATDKATLATTKAGEAVAAAAAAATFNPANYVPKSGVSFEATPNSVVQRDAGGNIVGVGLSGAFLALTGVNPNLTMMETDGAPDGKLWVKSLNGGLQTDYIVNDANNIGVPWRYVQRVGNVVAWVHYKAAIQQSVVALVASGNIFTPDCQLGGELDCGILSAAAIIANPTNVPGAGKAQQISIKWTQDGTGGRTVSFGANCINVGGAAANLAAGKTNFAVGKVYSDGKFYYSIVKGA